MKLTLQLVEGWKFKPKKCSIFSEITFIYYFAQMHVYEYTKYNVLLSLVVLLEDYKI